MSKFLNLFLALMIIAGCSPKKEDGNLVISTENGDVIYNVEEAQKPEELEKGLMSREQLAENGGMIFDLSKVDNQVAMWMKDTQLSLDMLFVNVRSHHKLMLPAGKLHRQFVAEFMCILRADLTGLE